MSQFKYYRKIRRDGSCFYRAVLFKIFEHILHENDKNTLELFEKTIKDSKNYLMQVGYEEFVIDDF